MLFSNLNFFLAGCQTDKTITPANQYKNINEVCIEKGHSTCEDIPQDTDYGYKFILCNSKLYHTENFGSRYGPHRVCKLIDEPNPKEAKNLGSGYLVVNGNIYYHELKLDVTDIDSFRILGDGFGGSENYAVDNNNIWMNGKRITDADPLTFKFFDNGYSIDKKSIYFISHDSIKSITTVEGADVDSFEPIYCDNTNRNNNDGIPNHYSVYGKDSNNVYYEGLKMNGADPNSFIILNCGHFRGYSKDKNYVYQANEIIQGANPNNFTLPQ